MNPNYWFFFSQNNWHDGGNSTEQYARSINTGMYINGGKSGLAITVGNLEIVPQKSDRIIPSLLEKTEHRKIAMFCKPIELFLTYLKICKENQIPTIYRCVDDWEVFENSAWYSKSIEQEMINCADFSFASSRRTASKFGIEYLPNACFKIEKSNPEDKIVGFMGLVDMDRFDIDLIEYLALAFPEVVFKLVGSKKSYQLPRNVLIFQQTSWQQTYELSKDFSIGIIPYKGDNLSGMQPIKTWEYLSRGIPQLCAKGLDLPEHESIFLYKDKTDCEKQLRFILENMFNRDNMIKFALENTWNKRIEYILGKLASASR